MKKLVWVGLCIASLLISACGGSVEPTASAEDAQATTTVVPAFTDVVETHTVIPTNTSIPSTETLVPTLAITDTPIPSPTIIVPTSTPTNADPCNKILSAWGGPSATFDFIYEYSPQGKDDKVIISVWVKTAQGECGFLADPSTGPVGQYSVAAYIDGEKDFKVFGGFRITEAKWDIVIRNDTIVALGSCYPNC